MTIRFGTDGWRAVIGEDFNEENVAQVAQAFADIYPTLAEAGAPVVVGYDRRLKSKESAELISKVLLGNGIPVLLSDDFCPTPAVSWTVKSMRACAGVMVTASHNPPKWNGIKFKESYGGAASADFLKPIELQIEKNLSGKKDPKQETKQNHPLLTHFRAQREYLENLKKLVNLPAIEKSGFRALADPLYGCGAGLFTKILGDRVTEIHTEADPNFGGLHPEPIRPYVDQAIEQMKSGRYSVCLITDGDADRVGAVDEIGNFVTSHEIFAVLLKHVVETRGWRGRVAKSISTTIMIDRLCQRYRMDLEATPVGFKFLSPAMRKPDMMMAGEESGGIGFAQYLCERDGLLCCLLLLEAMALRGRTLGQLVAEIQKEVGPCFFQRIDLKLTAEQMQRAKAKLGQFVPDGLLGKKLKERTTLDGYHFLLEDDSWLLMRPSGTEPLFRTYAEASSPVQVEALLKEARHLVA